ncbi:hypothetical protein [Peribacillus asahii]|uniref:hypothetical protein n=1 Tax=Peribacillus asahii TaxID=228899 RepID=UPI00207A2698|nr:hypothetical protein [Peribacillus asahii]USK70046.1 hypothetical protein LIS76_21560 [Peribacillus asahii]
MKTKWFSKVLASLVAITLVFGSTSFASAKGSENKKTEQKNPVKKEDKSSKNKEKEKEKKVAVRSKTGKTVEKRLNTIDSSIQKITKSINSYFDVSEAGTADKELSKKTASKKYNSYKGKLKAEINKLRAIDKQLASYKKKRKVSTSEFDALAEKSKELQKLAADEIERVKSLVKQASTPKTEEETTPAESDETTNTPEETTPTDSGETTASTDPVV